MTFISTILSVFQLPYGQCLYVFLFFLKKKLPLPLKCIESICRINEAREKSTRPKTKKGHRNYIRIIFILWRKKIHAQNNVWHVICCVHRTPLILVFTIFQSNFFFSFGTCTQWKIELNVCVNEFTLSKLIFIKNQ